jgi:hypothetical protein
MNNTVRKYPRSLEEAFGPYTSPRIDEPARRSDNTAAGIALAIIGGIVTAAMLVHWWSA